MTRPFQQKLLYGTQTELLKAITKIVQDAPEPIPAVTISLKLNEMGLRVKNIRSISGLIEEYISPPIEIIRRSPSSVNLFQYNPPTEEERPKFFSEVPPIKGGDRSMYKGNSYLLGERYLFFFKDDPLLEKGEKK